MPTPPDQMARIDQCEKYEIMFPKGVKQMLGFIYAMDGEVFRSYTWHAKMMMLREAFDKGYVRPFSLHAINMSGLAPVQVNGECAGLREQIELLLRGDKLAAVLAKYGRDDQAYTQDSVKALVEGLHDHLTRGWRKAQRSRAYCSDLIWHECCCEALYEKKYNCCAIASRYNVSQATVSRDTVEAKKYISAILAKSYRIIEEKFKDGVVLP